MKMSAGRSRDFRQAKRVSGKWVKQRERKAFKITELKELLKKNLRKVDVYYE
ncbi:hypothetical protein [Blautia wexlerae]|uniref:hypothetical protein n=1 Tax=Blautia wexlerae TaxID=418240 RepID=UPI0035BEAE87